MPDNRASENNLNENDQINHLQAVSSQLNLLPTTSRQDITFDVLELGKRITKKIYYMQRTLVKKLKIV